MAALTCSKLRMVWSLGIICHASAQTYTLVDDYQPSTFFDNFKFYTDNDPTNGFVQYVNQSYAAHSGLIVTYTDHVTIGVDTTNTYSPNGPGRPSVRIESLNSYSHALYILSLSHMPYACGSWPAYWSQGPMWPSHGEIDIIEGVNINTNNLMSLHTSDNCTVAGNNQTGILETSNCYEAANDNSGCGTESASNASYGRGFNSAGGGIYAMEWTSEWIRVWQFNFTEIPPSIAAGTPNPSTFGVPSANFQGSCDIDSHFGDHNIIFDITFCGDYAGNTYGSSSCPMTPGKSGYESCINYVAENPSAFSEAYWSIKYLKVYQQLDMSSQMTTSTVSTALSSVAPVAATASLSSIKPAMGVDSSSTSIGSSTLSIPSSIHSISSTSSHSTVNLVTSTSDSSASTSTTLTDNSLLPTSSGTPQCHTIFENSDGSLYRIYCNATINDESSHITTAIDFVDCINLCDHYNTSCTASIFNPISSSRTCMLETFSFSSRQNRITQLSFQNGTFVALRLESLSSPSPNDPEASAIRTVSGVTSIRTIILTTITTTTMCSDCTACQSGFVSNGISYINSVSLCYTCALTPVLVTITTTDSNPQTDTAGITVTSTKTSQNETPGESQAFTPIKSSTSAKAHTVPASSTDAVGSVRPSNGVGSDSAYCSKRITITTWLETTTTKCPTPLSCPLSTIASVADTSNFPNCPIEPAGRIYDDAVGMRYALYCNTLLVGSAIDRQTQSNLRDCIASCDMWNYMHFYPWGPGACTGVSFFVDGTSPNCILRSPGFSLVNQTGVETAILSSSVADVGSGNGSSYAGQLGTSVGSMAPAQNGLSTRKTGNTNSLVVASDGLGAGTGLNSGIFTTRMTDVVASGGLGTGTGIFTTRMTDVGAGSASYGYSTIISHGATIVSTYGVSTLISNGMTVYSTYGISTVTVTTTTTTLSATVSVSTSYIYATQTVTEHAGGGLSSSSSRTCRTAATHYGRIKNKREPLLHGRQQTGALQFASSPMPAAPPKLLR